MPMIERTVTTRVLVALAMAGMTAGVVGAVQPPGGDAIGRHVQAALDDRPEAVVYDVRQITGAPAELVPGVESGLAGGAAAPPTRPWRRPTVEQVIERLQREVAPETWGRRVSQGGSDLKELNGNLIITAGPAVHDRIRDMLAELRAHLALAVVVECRFIDEGDEPLKVGAALEPREGVDGSRWHGAVIDASAADRIIAEAERRGPAALMALWVRPEVSQDRSAVTLAINPRRARIEPGTPPHETAGQVVAVQELVEGTALVVRMPLSTTHLASARLEDGQLAAFDREPCPEPTSRRTVLVLVEPRIVLVDDV
jgi:hypothetical protein